MSHSLLLQQMSNLLMNQGKSIDEARELINQTDFTQNKKISLDESQSQHVHSIDSLVLKFSGLNKIIETFREQIVDDDSFSQESFALNQRSDFLKNGWDVLTDSRWMSWLYLTILTMIVFILQQFVAPEFTYM